MMQERGSGRQETEKAGELVAYNKLNFGGSGNLLDENVQISSIVPTAAFILFRYF